MIRQGMLTGHRSSQGACKNYAKAVKKGVVKVMSKMGISTIQSYRGAQIFEAIGLDQKFVDKYFTGHAFAHRRHWPGRDCGGSVERHRRAFPDRPVRRPDLDGGGQYQWRQDGEYHLFNPAHDPQAAVLGAHEQLQDLQGILRSRERPAQKHVHVARVVGSASFAQKPIPIEEVESVEAILKRFKTGAMSYGSISKEAHETLAIAMNRIGGKSNTGEGGEDPARYVPDANGDSRSSAIKQVASGRFGVTSQYLVNAKELQIKMAQGAKPGEGGQLPGHKVDP